jgi:hypothetical protein
MLLCRLKSSGLLYLILLLRGKTMKFFDVATLRLQSGQTFLLKSGTMSLLLNLMVPSCDLWSTIVLSGRGPGVWAGHLWLLRVCGSLNTPFNNCICIDEIEREL